MCCSFLGKLSKITAWKFLVSKQQTKILLRLAWMILTICIPSIQSFGTDRSEQTVQTQILQEQSDQGLHCLPFLAHLSQRLTM